MSDIQGGKNKVAIRGGKSKVTKESFFVRVPTPENRVGVFFNASAYIGKQMPYEKPLATCAMRVEDGVVAFSLLHLTKKSAVNIAAGPIVMPRPSLTRLMRKSSELPLEQGNLVLEMNDVFYRMVYTSDDNGMITVDTAPDQEDVTFDLPPRGVQLSLYLKSPKLPRTLAVSFIGHLGKPSTPETVVRAAAMVINAMSGLMEFRVLSGIEGAKVPAAPNKWAGRPPVRKNEDRVYFDLVVAMFTGPSTDLTPVGRGNVVVEVDLDHANPSTGHLLYHFTPADEIAENFVEFRDMVATAVSNTLSQNLGNELAEITYEVVLGEVDGGTIDRLRDALKGLVGVDVTTYAYNVHKTVED
jgi:hypothetical protein